MRAWREKAEAAGAAKRKGSRGLGLSLDERFEDGEDFFLLATRQLGDGGKQPPSFARWSVATGFGRFPAHQRTQQTLAEGNTWDYGYEALGQLTSAKGREAGGASRLQEQLSYGYDAAGNLTARTNHALIQTFTLNNSVNQLTSARRSGTLTVAGLVQGAPTSVTVKDNAKPARAATVCADQSFARAGLSPLDGANTFTAVAQDDYGRRATNPVTPWLPQSASFTYDLNGNLTGDGRRTFAYDDADQLKAVQVAGSWRSEFQYDGLGRRRSTREYVWASGNWTLASEVRYVYDHRVVLQERDGANVPQVTYTRGADLSGRRQGAGGIGGLLARSHGYSGGNWSSHNAYHADGNGNVTALVNRSGVLQASYRYDPYGRYLAGRGPLTTANVMRFSSKPWVGYNGSATSGLYYYGYRFYDPQTQRCLNRDPLGKEYDVNLYRYVYNSPLNYVDPDGLWGIQFGDFNIGWGDPNLAFDWDSWNDLGEGAAATVDGLIPFFDPFKDKYDPCDPIFAYSYAGGEIAQNAILTVTVLRAAAWLGGTRLGHGLNHNRYLRIGPGRMPRNGHHPPSTGVPRISVGPQRPGIQNPHRDLRLWPFD